MTKKQIDLSNTFEIPFLIYIAAVDKGQTLTKEDAESFIQTINDSNWCKSEPLQHILKKAKQQYHHSWEKYLSGEFVYPMTLLHDIYEHSLLELSATEKELYKTEFVHLVECLFNGSNNLFLESPKSKQKIHELIKSILLETAVKSSKPLTQDTSNTNDNTSANNLSLAQEAVSAKAVTSEELSVAQVWPLSQIDADNAAYWTRGKIDLRCVEIIDETHDAKTFRFIAKEEPRLFFFKPGQFIGLELIIDGKQVIRSYTISSTPSRPHTLSITVKRVPGGQVSNWLHDNLQVDDCITANGPNGKFNCFDYPAKKMLLISGGSGITPVMSMMRWLADTSSDVDIVFLHNARTPHDIIFAKELDLISSMHSNINIVISVSDKASDGWQGFTGRISPQLIEMIAPDFMERNVYVCGPGEYMSATQDILQWMNFPMQNYYSESFGAAPKKSKTQASYSQSAYVPASQQSSSSSPTITTIENKPSPSPTPSVPPSSNNASADGDIVIFQQSSKQVAHNSSTAILDIAEDEGVDIPSACRYGSCGTCKVLKIEGEVSMDAASQVLSVDEINDGYILACCSVPKGKVVIDA